MMLDWFGGVVLGRSWLYTDISENDNKNIAISGIIPNTRLLLNLVVFAPQCRPNYSFYLNMTESLTLVDFLRVTYKRIFISMAFLPVHNILNCMKEVTWLKLCLVQMGTGQLLWSGCLSSCSLCLYKQQW